MPSEYDPKPLADETPGDSGGGGYDLASPRQAPPPLPLPPPIHAVPPIVPGPLPPSNGKAMTAMVLGIVSCATVCFCYGVPSIICGILAIIFARQAETELATGLPNKPAASQVRVGRICGIIGLCVGAVIVLVCVAVVIMAIIAESAETP